MCEENVFEDAVVPVNHAFKQLTKNSKEIEYLSKNLLRPFGKKIAKLSMVLADYDYETKNLPSIRKIYTTQVDVLNFFDNKQELNECENRHRFSSF